MKRLIYLMLVGFLVWQAPAFAETFKATVTDVNVASNQLTVTPLEKTDKLPASVNLTVKDNTKFKGAASTLGDVKTGSEVKVNAKENNGTWEAKSVEVTNASGTSAAGPNGTMNNSSSAGTANTSSTTTGASNSSGNASGGGSY